MRNAKRQKPHHAELFIEPWRETIWLEWNCDQADLEKIVEDHFHDDQDLRDSPWRGRWVYARNHVGTGSNVHIIALKTWTGGPEDLGTLVHECFHAVEFMLTQKGIRHHERTSEVFAYTLDHVFQLCLEAIQKRGGKLAT